MSDSLLELSELDDAELVPEILPAAASLDLFVGTEDLRSLVLRASHITPLKEVVPGTAHARLDAVPASGDHLAYLRLTASDGEQTTTLHADDASVNLKVPGSVLIPPKRVLDILKLAPEDRTRITVVANTVFIRSGRAQWSLGVPHGDVADLSGLVDVSEIEMSEVDGPAFLKALAAVRKATSTSTARVSLMQIQIKDAHLLACDGGRLHQAFVPGLDASIDTTIPVKVADELIRALSGAPSLLLGSGPSSLVFHVGDDSLVAQRLILDFPAVGQILFNARLTNTHSLGVERVALDEAIKRVRVNSDPDIAVVSLNVVRGPRSADDRLLEVRSQDRAGNSAREVLECQWEGKERSISFNHHHLSDLLSVCEAEYVRIKLGDDTKSTKLPLLIEDTANGVAGVVQQVTQHW